MFCPNCGQKTNIEQSYCRLCGVELGETSHKISKYYADLEGEVDWFKRAGLFFIGIAASFILVFSVMIILIALRIGGDGLPSLLLLLTILTTVLSGTVSVLYFEGKQSKKLKKELAKYKAFAPVSFETKTTGKMLNESTIALIGSVTDNTTELFTSKIPRTRTSGELS